MRQRGERLAYKWKVLISVVFGVFMVVLDSTVVNIALRTLQAEFSATVSASQWVISIYVLALGVSTPLSGYLGDRFGRKRIFLLGLGSFTAASLACGLAGGLDQLIVARALQGLGGGIALPLGTAMLLSAFPRHEQGLAFGIFGMAVVIAPALGPLLGGYLVDLDAWRWIFFVNVPIGALGVTLGSVFLREARGDRAQRFDALGFALSTAGFGLVLYGAALAGMIGWHAPRVVALLVGGAVALALFAVVELYRARAPLLDLRLFTRRVFTSAVLLGWVSVVALFGAEFLLPLYLQIVRGRTALEAGLLLVPLAAAAAVATPTAGRLYDRIGPRPLVVVGFGLLAVNTWHFARLTQDTPMAWVAALVAIRGVALGMTVQTTLVTALSVVPGPLLSRGSALINATRYVVQAVAVAALAMILAASLTPDVRERVELVAASRALAHDATIGLCDLPGQTPPVVTATMAATIERFCHEYVRGLSNAYRVTFHAALLAILLGLFLPGWPGRWQGRTQPAGPSLSSS